MQQDDWLNFWFKPQLFIHQSWFGELDERLLNQNSSSLAWNLSYDYVCDCYCLPKDYAELGDGLVKKILQNLLKNDDTIIDLAAKMMSGMVVDRSISVDIRRKILQRHRALSLKKRFLEACCNLGGKESGIYFVYLVVNLLAPDLWRRMRLLFPSEVVENIELAIKQVTRSEANENAVKRAWVEIFNIKEEIKPEFAIVNADEPIADIDAEAANDQAEGMKGESTDQLPKVAAG